MFRKLLYGPILFNLAFCALGSGLRAQTTSSGCSAIIARPNQQIGGANLAGFTSWGGQSSWTRDISADLVDPNSSTWVASVKGSGTPALYPDPVVNTVVVTAGQTRMPVPITSYPSVSEFGPYPVPLPPIIEGITGGNYNIAGDKHFTIIDKDNCLLYETYNTVYDPITHKMTASVGTVWDLLAGDHQRPYLWAAGSVAGVPWSHHAIRYDEVASGQIKHALTFAALGATGRSAFTDMATSSQYGRGNLWTLPPFGARARLKANFNISGFAPHIQVILKALKQYGMVYIDGSAPIDMHVEVDDRWNWTELNQLRSVLFNATNFEFVKTGPIYTDPMYGSATAPPKGPPPTIGSFTASASSVLAGTAVTLSWAVSGAASRVRIITPAVGPVVTNSVVVTPAATTTYTLAVENAYGVSRKTVTVNVVAGSCVGGTPAVAISPASQPVAPGQHVSYLVSVTNTDSSGCVGETFPLSHTLPAGWTGTYSPATLAIPPGGSATTTLTVAPPANAQGGANSITAAVSGMAGTGTAAASALFSAAATSTSLSLLTVSPASVPGGKSALGTVTLGNAAPSGGAVVALTSSSSMATVPSSVTVSAGATSATFTIATKAVGAATSATVSATYLGTVRTAALTVTAPVLSALTTNPASITGGSSGASNTVVMTGPVAAATTVALSSSNPSAAAVPSSVTIPAGASSATFTITSAVVSTSTVVAITGSYGGVVKSASIAVQPAALSADVLLSPATAVGGFATTANTVVLSAPATVSTTVALSSANAVVAAVPSQVIVPAGASSAAFTTTTSGVSAQTLVTITATLGGAKKSKTLTVNPVSLSLLSIVPNPVVGGATASSGSVSLDGPAGLAGVVVSLKSANPALASVPATITVPAGATKSPSFPITTSSVAATTTVAVSATYGAVTKTVNLTLNPAPTTVVALSSLSLSPASVTGGTATLFNTVTLNAPAGPGGVAVALWGSNRAVAAVAPTVTVPAGATKSPAFQITTARVTASTTVAITASYGGVTKTVNLTINP